MSTLRVDSIRGQTADGTDRYIVQIKSTTKTDTFSTTSTSQVDVTGFNVTITPSSSSHKILITGRMPFGRDNNNTGASMRLLRTVGGTSTEIGSGDASGDNRPSDMMELSTQNANNLNEAGINFLDTPSTTSSITYQVQIKSRDGSEVAVNRTGDNSNQVYNVLTSSTITVMEIAQ
jgi:hypothetical protein|tara:strand:+ start:139 stop:666 length:528 start_codon:yes stop_codon:yes gene_type:complete